MNAAVLVFGRSGQLAQELARLSEPEYPIIAIGRETCDLAAGGDPSAIITAYTPRLVINAAAYTAVDQAETEAQLAQTLNSHAPGAIAMACAAGGIPFIHVSTDYVFSGGKGAPYVESDPRAPLGIYGASKAAGEDSVTAASGCSAIVRIAWLYSVFGSNFPKTMLRLAGSRAEISVVDDQLGRPTSARFVAEHLLALGERMIAQEPAAMGLFHLAPRGDATWADFAQAVFQQSKAIGGPTAGVKRINTADFPTLARRPLDSRLDSSKLEAVLRVTFPDWRELLSPTLAEMVGPTKELARA